MRKEVLEFTAKGSPRSVSRAVEEFAAAHGSLSAIVVPWESDDVTLSMAVTSSKGDGWAIEHTNLGTIRLTELGGNFTRVAITAEGQGSEGTEKLASLFSAFACQIESRFRTTS